MFEENDELNIQRILLIATIAIENVEISNSDLIRLCNFISEGLHQTWLLEGFKPGIITRSCRFWEVAWIRAVGVQDHIQKKRVEELSNTYIRTLIESGIISIDTFEAHLEVENQILQEEFLEYLDILCQGCIQIMSSRLSDLLQFILTSVTETSSTSQVFWLLILTRGILNTVKPEENSTLCIIQLVNWILNLSIQQLPILITREILKAFEVLLRHRFFNLDLPAIVISTELAIDPLFCVTNFMRSRIDKKTIDIIIRMYSILSSMFFLQFSWLLGESSQRSHRR